MEYNRYNRFESTDESDKTDSETTPKKAKKKTTKFPILKTLEETSETKKSDQEPENILENLFAKAEDKKPGSEEDTSTESDSLESEAAESFEEVTSANELAIKESSNVETQEQANEVELSPDQQVQIAGEFNSEVPVTISRNEAEPTNFIKDQTETRDISVENTAQDEATPYVNAEQTASQLEQPVEVSEQVRPNYERYQPSYEQQIGFRQERDVQTRHEVAFSSRPNQEQTGISQTEIDDIARRAEKRGLRRGVVSGGLVGWWIGRRGKRAALREAEQAIRHRDKEIKDLNSEQSIQRNRYEAMEKSQKDIEKSINQYKLDAERSEKSKRFEQTTASEKLLSKEKLPEDQEITEETYKAPAGRRVETSSWHSIEVDEKTGKAVTNPERAYGREFDNERAQEKLRGQASDPGLAAQFGHSIVQTSASTVKSKQHQKQQLNKKTLLNKQQLNYARKQIVESSKKPTTWLLALVIVIILFIFGILG